MVGLAARLYNRTLNSTTPIPQRSPVASDDDVALMRRALELAANGLGLVSPNPLVGCVITDANGKVQEARGDGVVGEQPHLKPGQGFRYTSGAVIETPVGAMQGTYEMIDDAGQRFDAPIQPFRLAMPGILQ